MSLPLALERQLRGDLVVLAVLVEFDFFPSRIRVWNGVGSIMTSDGRTWRGVADFGGISGLGAPGDMQAQAATFELRAGDAFEPEEFTAAAQSDLDAEVDGRAVRVYVQAFDPETGAQIDNPLALWAGVMSHIEVEWSGLTASRITLTAETVFAEKRKPPFGQFNGQDQRARFAGDAGLDYVETLVNRKVLWPRD